MFITL